jgi:hypothetical protein
MANALSFHVLDLTKTNCHLDVTWTVLFTIERINEYSVLQVIILRIAIELDIQQSYLLLTFESN